MLFYKKGAALVREKEKGIFPGHGGKGRGNTALSAFVSGGEGGKGKGGTMRQ